MKVSDFMRTSVVSVNADEPIRTVVKLIFNLGIKSIPVVHRSKLVGIVTEEDILTKLFPSVKDFMEDRSRAFDFESMEENLGALMNEPVKNIMSSKPKFVQADTPIMRAQSSMIINRFSHLPVTDNQSKLIGIISQGDIFRAVVGQEIPYDSNEEYHAWLSRHWDLVVPWKQRLNFEIQSFNKILEKNYSYRILDIFCGTGEHAIALAHEGYDVVGMNKYVHMHNAAMKKHAALPDYLKNRITFMQGDYCELLKDKKEDYDAAIFMGNALPHNPEDYKKIIKNTSASLTKKNALMVLQIANFDKILNINGGLQTFHKRPSKLSDKAQYIFIEYYDKPTDTHKNLTLNMCILGNAKDRWTFAALNSTPIAYITAEEITALLKSVGFTKITLYGSGVFNEPLFDKKFSPTEHEYLNVVATR